MTKKLAAWTDDSAMWIDKPAPYSLVKHVEQIRVDADFHEWYIYKKKKLRARVGLE